MDKIYQVKDFTADQASLALQETIFHNANGYLGVRGTLEEGLPEGMDTMRGTYINAFYDMVPMKQAELLCGLVEDKEALVNVADTQTIKAEFAGEEFSLFSGRQAGLTRSLNMSAGVTSRSLTWTSPSEKSLDLEIRRMTSFTEKSLFAIDYRVKSVDFAGKVKITSLHQGIAHNYADPNDPRMAAESGEHIIKVEGGAAEGISVLESRTAETDLHLVSAVSHEVFLNGEKLPEGTVLVSYDSEAHEASAVIEIDLEAGDELRVVKYSVFADSRRAQDVVEAAGKKMAAVLAAGIDKLYDAQRKYLNKFWDRALLEIDGDDELNRSVQFNMYALLQSAGTDGLASIPAKGLSGEGYEGHYFWDTEMFMLPFFDMNDPEVARKLLSYRYQTLPAARENARTAGHKKGALYPWRTITGRECSGYYPSGTAAYHINGDIAYAVIQYYLCTGDDDYLLKEGFEILVETSRIWIDMGAWKDGKFNINCVTGPDEYTCMINNNYFTNAAARFEMEWILRLTRKFGEDDDWKALFGRLGLTLDEVEEMRRAAEGMNLVYDEELGINPQDDSFLQKPVWDLEAEDPANFPLLMHYHPLKLYRYQVCKQADTVLAHFLFPQYQDMETIRNSFRYYEKITTHDSSLSTCVFSIVASMLGLRDEAIYYMGDSAKMDLMNTHKNSKDGIHAANMGGSYMAIVNGLGLVRMHEDHMSLAPWLPESFKGYTFRITYRGSLFEVAVSQEEVKLTLLSGKTVPVEFYGENVSLAEGESISR